MRGPRAILLLVVLVGVLSLKCLTMAAIFVSQARAETESLMELLNERRAEVARIPIVGDSVTRLEREIARLPLILLAGKDPGTSALDLSRRVTLIASSPTATLDSMRMMPETTASGPFRRLSIDVFVESDGAGLVDFMRSVEGDPALSISRFEIRAEDPRSSDDAAEVLEGRLTISAWYRAEEPEGSRQVAQAR
jgi:hypothetical protein